MDQVNKLYSRLGKNLGSVAFWRNSTTEVMGTLESIELIRGEIILHLNPVFSKTRCDMFFNPVDPMNIVITGESRILDIDLMQLTDKSSGQEINLLLKVLKV